MERVAVYPGSFDPVTYGHLDIIERGLKMFDKLIIAVAHNPEKKPLFSVKERVEMLRETTSHLEGVEIADFAELLVEYAAKRGVKFILRGLRAISDFEYEFQMALTNYRLNPQIETVYLMTSENFSYFSSRLIKQIAFSPEIKKFVPEVVVKRLRVKGR